MIYTHSNSSLIKLRCVRTKVYTILIVLRTITFDSISGEISCTPKIDALNFEVGSWKLEVGSRKSEVGSRKSEVGSRKSPGKSLLGFRTEYFIACYTVLTSLRNVDSRSKKLVKSYILIMSSSDASFDSSSDSETAETEEEYD